MNDMIDYKFDDAPVRVVLIDSEPWWVANDIAKVLGYAQAAFMTRNLEDDEKGMHIVQTLGGRQELSVISESGLFAAILKSRRDEAKRFRKWVTSVVLPSLRRTGSYTMHNEPAPMLPAPLINSADLPAWGVAMEAVRQARAIFGAERARVIWMKCGLPSPIAEASGREDALAKALAAYLSGKRFVQLAEVAAAIGAQDDRELIAILPATMRLLGWYNKKSREGGPPMMYWYPLFDEAPIAEAPIEDKADPQAGEA